MNNYDQKKLSNQVKHNRKYRWLRIPVITVLSLLFLVVVIFNTAKGRSIAQEFAELFRHADGDLIPREILRAIITEEPIQTGTPTPNPGDIKNLIYTIEEIEQMVGHHIAEPSWLPFELVFEGASYDPVDQEVFINYDLYVKRLKAGDGGLFITQELNPTSEPCFFCGLVGASVPIERVKIGSVMGEYVIGMWHFPEEGAVYEPFPFIQRLRWRVDGVEFEFYYLGDAGVVTKEELIAIAASME